MVDFKTFPNLVGNIILADAKQINAERFARYKGQYVFPEEK